jgi:AcrR family transcriptional regulator
MSSHTAASNTSTTSTASTGTAGTTGTTDTPSTPAATSERILDAALACAAELGLTQLTLEEVATRAEVSRQTVYRHFGRREALISAVIVREESALLATVQAATQAASTLPEAVEIAVVELYRQARAHPLLDRLLRDEPGAILPYLLPGNAPVIAAAEDVISDLLDRFAADLPADRRAHLADITVRLCASYVVSPADVDIEAVAREFARLLDATLASATS